MVQLSFSRQAQTFIKDAKSGFKLSLYFLKNLPSAWWWGLRLKHADEESCQVTIPYNWRTKNPFRSIYFAALAGAGEFSTGLPASIARMGRGSIAMLVIDQKMEFVKKATGVITFTCNDIQKVIAKVEEASETGEPVTCEMESVGANENGEVVARFYIVWSFKKRKGK